jgi:hypothetical protein
MIGWDRGARGDEHLENLSIRNTLRVCASRGTALALAALLTSAGVALAGKQVKGATYIGHYTAAAEPVQAVSFKVSANGKKVIDLTVQTPFKCNGGCGGVGTPSAGTARITRAGTFKVTLKIPAPGPGGKSEGTDTVTGTFHAHHTASGTVTSHFNHSSGGVTKHWTATG